MATMSDLFDTVALQRLVAVLAGWLPVGALALASLVGGTLLALLARRLVRATVRKTGLDAFAERLGIVRLLYAVNLRSGVDVMLGNLAAIATLLVTAMVVAETVGLPGIADGLASVVEFLPRFVAAGVVALVGFVGADLASRLAEGFGRRREDLIAPRFAASVVYYVVLTVALATAVQHLGLNTALVDGLILLVCGAFLASVGLSLALGTRDMVRDVLARQYLREAIQPGDRVEVGDVEGTVVRYDSVTVVLRKEDGSLHLLPCSALLSAHGVQVFPADTDANR